ncbi:MAG: coniferyl aldehyde dehydrogenase [Xanthomonadales bacterium]|nr:coniferyl aldehyde dehydrogenase [Gammaproteobacteria bacterium]MBT8074301.1 coniferyl aldehyde dehydrogenase [Gammaproteobacteria bacterium]MBT8074834.1 coniferyl aldehyde dehydrogenase [Gammaproteobacteria bacterium]NNK05154.1 coniferyl aldehyde dehydrogenase [Xanthomonadales bacterium]NNK99099.1 coniferyl aldehyde dehydrogenase [Xanthomonadales bacterium]
MALRQCLELQKAAYNADPVPTLEQRKRDLLALKSMLGDNREAIADAISKDYGNRSRHETMLAEVIMVLDGLNFAVKHLKKWMKVQKREIEHSLYPGAKNRVIPQPLGVVGVIVPWNFPVQLAFTPLTYIFAAGNRAMVKMSENSIHLSHLLIKLVPDYFPPEKLSFFEETGAVGIQFSQLPFDHLLFTGSGATGKAVMASAAKNLTPVTLELGGKSPAVIAPDYPIQKAVERIMFAKLFNAGQVCVNVDYLFVSEDRTEDFVAAAKSWVAKHCPDIRSPDYTSIIDQRSFDRLTDALEDARKLGAKIINLAEGQNSEPELRKMTPQLVLNTNDDMILMQREIFGPILPVLPYKDQQEVRDYINQRDRPLAFYPFTKDRELQKYYLDHVMSGGACVNDALIHPGQHDLPFGGVGASGMGHYHGYEGFATFSKLRPVFYQAGFSSLKFLAPPYGKFADRMLNFILKKKL